MKSFKKILINKRFILITSFILFISMIVVLNTSFSIFTNQKTASLTNIKVAGL